MRRHDCHRSSDRWRCFSSVSPLFLANHSFSHSRQTDVRSLELSRRVLVYLIIFGMVSGDIMLFPCEGAYLLFYEGVVGYMVFDLHILLGQLHCESSPRAS